MGILTDQYRPGNTEISPDLGFADSLQKNIDNLTRMQREISIIFLNLNNVENMNFI